MVGAGRVPHAIMFSSADGGSALEVALAFLQLLYCQNPGQADSCGQCPSCNKVSKLIHPDIHFVFPTSAQTTSASFLTQWRNLVLSNPRFTEEELAAALGIEGKNSLIAVSEAKSLLGELSLTALEGGYRAVLIYLPEKMNKEAANRLLKIIEEPPLKTQFVLVTHAPEKVLQTIESRCQRIHIPGDAAISSFQDPSLLTSLMQALCRRDLLGSLEVGESLAALPSRENAKLFCKFASSALRDVFLLQQGLPAAGTAPAEAREWAARCRKTFPRMALAVFDRAAMMIDRNVSLKIVFADLVGKLYTLI